MADDTPDSGPERGAGPDASASDSGPAQGAGSDPSPEEPKTRGIFEDVARVIGRTAGRTKDALVRLGERGALAVAVRRIKRQRALKLKELGRIARKALSPPGGLLRHDDPSVAEMMQAMDRLDEKLAQMQERIEKGVETDDEEAGRGPRPDDEAKAGGPREE